MHICYIYHHAYPANFSTAINEYTRHLSENGIDVTVIAGREARSERALDDHEGVTVHRILTDLSTSVSIEPTLFGYRALRKLEKVHQSTEVDVLHLRSFPNLGLILSPLPWLSSPDAVVSDVRGTAVSNRYFEKLSKWGIRLQDRLVDETLIIDEHVASQIFPPKDDIPIVPLGVDFNRFTPSGTTVDRSAWNFRPEDIILGYTGNLHRSRELDRLLEAFAIAHERIPHLKLVVVGGGADYNSLRRTTVEYDIEEPTVFTGSVPFEDVPKYVRTFDIGAGFVADKPQYRNQPPLKTVEFLACGLPVLATDTPGNKRFVSHGENSLVVNDSVTEYAEALKRLAEEPALRKRLGENARASVAEYDYERIVTERLIPLYQELQKVDERDID